QNQTWERTTTWTQVSTASAPGARDEQGATWDMGRQKLVLHGGLTAAGTPSAETWEYSATQGHGRYATQLFEIYLGGNGLRTLTSRGVGGGGGAAGGVSTRGATLAIWNNSTGAWTTLGTNTALDTDSAALRTITSTPATPAIFERSYKLWLMVRSTNPSS